MPPLAVPAKEIDQTAYAARPSDEPPTRGREDGATPSSRSDYSSKSMIPVLSSLPTRYGSPRTTPRLAVQM